MTDKAIEAACKTLSKMWEEGNSLPAIMQAILWEYEAAKGDGWLPISELKHGGRVLYKRKGSKTVKVGWLTSSKEFLSDDGRLECGAMWQPLPKAPAKAEG